jgi:hypothetical protein
MRASEDATVVGEIPVAATARPMLRMGRFFRASWVWKADPTRA